MSTRTTIVGAGPFSGEWGTIVPVPDTMAETWDRASEYTWVQLDRYDKSIAFEAAELAEAAADLDCRFPAGPVTTALDWDNTAGDVDRAGTLEPGSEGWWPVHGARAMDIRPGDRVMRGWKDEDDPEIKHHAEAEVVDLAPWGDLRDSCRVRFTTTAGGYASVGMLQPMALIRRGTHRTLAGSIR